MNKKIIVPTLQEIMEIHKPNSVLFVPRQRERRNDLNKDYDGNPTAYSVARGNALDEMRVTMPTRFENAIAYLHDSCFTDVSFPTRDAYDLVFIAGNILGDNFLAKPECEAFSENIYFEVPGISQKEFDQAQRSNPNNTNNYFRINKTGKRSYITQN